MRIYCTSILCLSCSVYVLSSRLFPISYCSILFLFINYHLTMLNTCHKTHTCQLICIKLFLTYGADICRNFELDLNRQVPPRGSNIYTIMYFTQDLEPNTWAHQFVRAKMRARTLASNLHQFFLWALQCNQLCMIR